jgi:hypothetical protein
MRATIFSRLFILWLMLGLSNLAAKAQTQSQPPAITDIADRTVAEDTSTGPIQFTLRDADTALDKLILSASSSDQSLVPDTAIAFAGAGANRTVTVTPGQDQFGTVRITVTVTDGISKAADTFTLTVTAVNDRPTISNIPDQTIQAGSAGAPIPFNVGDVDTPLANLTFLAVSSNSALVPPANIKFAGSGANHTVSVTPAANQTGSATLTVTVSDSSLSANDSFVFTVTAAAEPPKIVQQPQSRAVSVGESVTFNVSATGTPPLSYQWLRNGQSLRAVEPILTISSVQSTDAGDYTVVVKNAGGSVTSAPATLAIVGLDFGDAPDPSFPTTLKNNGARHAIQGEFRLGNLLDAEPDGQPSADAKGDDAALAGTADDEDGVTFTTPLIPGQAAKIDVIAPRGGRLDAWVDFNANGTWADGGEQIFVSQALTPGLNSLSFTVPSSAKAATTFARFRLSSQGGLKFEGLATDGEVEDYQIGIVAATEEIDFGDAPQAFPTVLSQNGARHRIVKGFNLGRTVDPESDGQPSATATGDDTAPPGAIDDEDGVVFKTPLEPGKSASIDVLASDAGRLDTWIDFNGNGSWADAGERVFSALPLAGGVNALSFAVPATAKVGSAYARFRFSREGVQSFAGLAPDGEVEDYQVTIAAVTEELDFGDAPELQTTGFPTTLARNGARHRIQQGFHLGRLEDGETNGQPNAAATGDDAAGGPDDEDGVRFLSALVPGTSAQVEITTTSGGRLDAWIDFGRNLNWSDPTDRIFTSQAVSAGVTLLTFSVPATAQPGIAFARFRLSREGGLSFDGDGGIGEVEDHVARIERSTPCDLGCEGTDFWLTFPGNYAPDPANPVRPKLCLVGNPSTAVTVSIPGLSPPFNANVTIPASMMVEVNLPAGADLGDANDVIEKKGVHVVATQPVSIHALSKVDFTSDGYLALPTEVLGTEHYVLAYRNVHAAVPELNGSQFAIVASETNTTVTIMPSVVTGARDSGIPYTITLQAGHTYQLRTTTGAPADLTGTRILSDKPIAVFGSHACANVNSDDEFFCDYLVEQLPPVNRWASEFYARRLATRSNGDTLRVLASQDNTVVSMDGIAVATLGAGKFFEAVRPSSTLVNATQITATRPVLVAQYANSSDFDAVINSDPFMSLVPGRPHFSPQHHICVPAGFLTSHINVIAPTGVAVLLDGAALGGFSQIGGSGFSQTTAPVTPGMHSVASAQPVGVNVYGWNRYESYGWPSCLFFGDTTPPTVTCPPPITVTLGTTGTAGAAGTRCQTPVPDLRSQVTFTDNCPRPAGTVAAAGGILQDPPPGTLLGPGVHEIRLSVSDAQGNVGTCITTFTVIDPNPNPNAQPVLNCPTNMVVSCTDNSGARVEYKSFALIGCNEVPLDCKPASGSLFPVGTTTVTCTLARTNQPLTCSFTVTVTCRPQINVKLDQATLTLNWEGGAVLQVADSPLGPWTDVLNTGGRFVVDTTQTRQKFFRLR